MPVQPTKKQEEIFTYLKTNKFWSELYGEILIKLSEIFENDPASFKDFTTISEHYNLIKENFLEIAKIEKDTDCVIFLFADVFHSLGADLMKQFSQNNNDDYKTTATVCYKLSAKINPLLITAYISLAVVYGNFNEDVNTAINYCDLGIGAFNRLPSSVLHESNYLLNILTKLKNDFLCGGSAGLDAIK